MHSKVLEVVCNIWLSKCGKKTSQSWVNLEIRGTIFLILEALNKFLNVITTRKTHQFDLGFISRNNSQKRNQKTKKTKKKHKKNKQTHNQTNKQTPSLYILTIAGVFARNDQTLNTQIFPIAPALSNFIKN